MINITFIGSGNVAQHLIDAFLSHPEINIQQLFVRNPSQTNFKKASFEVISNWNQLLPADVFILAVSDDAIAEVAAQVPLKNQLIVHTSGSVSLNEINADNRRGVFYPLQTFTKGKPVDFTTIPICIETEYSADLEILQKIAHVISDKIFVLNSNQRRALHVAAVFVNNFVNHLYQMGNEICLENNIPFSILEPLITETANKIKTLTPPEAQTGPAKRKDQNTINAHLDFLKSDGTKQTIYKILTQSIQNNGQEL